MMSNLEKNIHSFCEILKEEISTHRLLIHEMKKESDYLRSGSVNALMETVKKIEQYAEKILGLRGMVQASMVEVAEALGKKSEPKGHLTGLLTALPAPHRERIRSLQKTLLQLQERVQRMNDRNKSFIQESMAYLEDLISFLIHPAFESSDYLRTGQKRVSPPLPYALNREV